MILEFRFTILDLKATKSKIVNRNTEIPNHFTSA